MARERVGSGEVWGSSPQARDTGGGKAREGKGNAGEWGDLGLVPRGKAHCKGEVEREGKPSAQIRSNLEDPGTAPRQLTSEHPAW